MKKLLLLSCVGFFGLASLNAQDIHFSQADLSPTFYNPAAAGSEYGNLRVNTIYKDQWAAQTANPFTTYYFGADYGFYSKENAGKKAYVGVGLNAFYDKAGAGGLTNIDGSLLVSVNMPLNKNSRLSVGMSLGASQRSVEDVDAYSWDNDWTDENGYTPGSGGSYIVGLESLSTGMVPDYGLGVYYTYTSDQKAMRKNDERRLDVGVSVAHLTEPDMALAGGEDSRHRKYTFYSEFSYGLNYANTTLKPLFVYNKQGIHQEYLTGIMFDFQIINHSRHTGYIKETSLGFGTYYRVGDAFIFAARAEVGRIAVSYSYDVTASKLPSNFVGRGGSEISLSFALPNPNGKRSRYGRTYF